MRAVSLLLLGCFACTGDIDEPPSTLPPVDPPPIPDDNDGDGIPDELIPAPSGLRRLTQSQYRNSVYALTGIDVDAATALEPDSPSNGFVSVGNARTTISARGVEQYEDSAYAIAGRIVENLAVRAVVVGCDPAAGGCYSTFVENFGRRIWRRPLTSDEVVRWVNVASEASSTLGDPWAGVEFVLAGFLQSPHFLFRPELGSGEAVGEGETAGRRFDDWEMASRISFTICNSTPDDALLDAAEAGELSSDATLRGHVERLAASDCSRIAIRGLFDEVMALPELDNMVKDHEVYPQASDSLGPALRESLLSTVEHWAVDDETSYADFFTRNDALVNDEVAALYGVEGASFADAFELGTMPAVRAGLLTHGAVLARYSHSEATSPTLRGKFVRTNILCQTIPAPPDDVGELPEATSDAPTLRERLAAHRENAACAGCHSLMDPIGLALENFDGVGAWRERENDVVIDASGELDGDSYDNALGLGAAVAEHPDLMECMVRNLYRYATGHIETPGETRSILLLEQEFERDGLLRSLLVDLVMSEGFRTAGEPQ